MSGAITVKTLLEQAGQHLKVGDIVLSRSRTLSSHLIRLATGSLFSHAALVFLVAQPEEGFNNTFLLESVSGGVGLANLRDYVGGRRPREDIVILRLEGEGLDDTYFRKVRGLMLDRINSGYDFNRALRMGLKFLFGSRLAWFSLSRGKSKSMRAAVARTKTRTHTWVPPEFICSGFIQYGLVQAAGRLGLNTNVMLKDGLSANDKEGILALTPEDIAQSHRLTWRFAVTRGWAHPVTTLAEAKARLR
ncbi:MAG: YiiX/YebB-like N1pC/P60 family cysteine hydrolase [Hyphomicrobiales bacterium]